MIPPDVVKATVGETVTAVTVVSVVSVLLHVLLVAHELDCVVQVVVKVESLLVTGSNCKIKQVRLTIDSYLTEHHSSHNVRTKFGKHQRSARVARRASLASPGLSP